MLCRRSTKGWAKKRDVVGIDFGRTHRWQLANKFQGADKVDRRGLDDEGLPPGILLALENIRWLVSFIPRQNISGAIPQIRLLLIFIQNSQQWKLIPDLLWFRVYVYLLHCASWLTMKFSWTSLSLLFPMHPYSRARAPVQTEQEKLLKLNPLSQFRTFIPFHSATFTKHKTTNKFMLFFIQGFLFFCHTAVHCCSTKPSASIIFDSMVSTSAAEALPPPSV